MIQKVFETFNEFVEIKKILKKLKRNKATGPDNTQAELYQWLDHNSIFYLTNILNAMWKYRHLPEALSEATVVSIFKKGDSKNLRNYRPISLLNSIYKIYASMIKRRIMKN